MGRVSKKLEDWEPSKLPGVPDPPLTVSQVCTLMNVSGSFVRTQVQKGEWPRIGKSGSSYLLPAKFFFDLLREADGSSDNTIEGSLDEPFDDVSDIA